MKPKLPFQIRKRQMYSLVFFGILIIISQLSFSLYKSSQVYKIPEIQFISEIKPNIILTDFNPNDLDEKQWKNLGFSDKQIKTILNTKKLSAVTSIQKHSSRNATLFLKKNIRL